MSGGEWIRIGAVKAHLDAKTLNSIIAEALGKKATSITQMPDLRKEIGEEFIKAVTPFVPYKSGDLARSGRATDDGRVYWTSTHNGYNYAHSVYDPNYARWPEGSTYVAPTTEGTHPRWVDRVHPGTAEWSAFVNNITPIIIRRFAEDE